MIRFCEADPMPGRQAVRPARAAAVVLILLGLALVALTARSGRTETVRPQTAPATVTVPPRTVPPRRPDGGETAAPAQQHTAPASLGPLVAIAAVFILAIVGAFLWIVVERIRMSPGRLRRYRAPVARRLAAEQEERPDPTVLAVAVEAGLRELEEGGPGEGVVACWVQLERAAEEAGAGRAAPETPSELAGRLIDTHGVRAAPLVRLAQLYREARYSAHPVPEAARTEARELLEQVRADLVLATASLAVRPRGGSR